MSETVFVVVQNYDDLKRNRVNYVQLTKYGSKCILDRCITLGYPCYYL